MGLSRFNQSSSSSSSGGGILYRPKPLVLPYQLYGTGTGSTSAVPVWRSGAGTKSFEGTSTASIILYTTSSLGVRTATATISYTTYLGSGAPVAFHLNSSDTCLYVLLSASGSFRFIKIDDTTGVVTTIGSSFTPTTLANWGGGSQLTGTLSIDSVSGHLKYVNNGFYHLINKTTGAIVSQDTPISLGSYLGAKVVYVTQDGMIGVTAAYGSGASITGFTTLPNLVHSSYGHISNYTIPAATSGLLSVYNTTSSLPLVDYTVVLVDNDKICISAGLYSAGVNALGAKYYLLSEWDKLIKSVAEVGAGVI